MHEKWEALIPYYVARTLTREEAQALEMHISNCSSCAQAVDEWRQIAVVVWESATEQSRELPPLSKHVRDNLNNRPDSVYDGELYANVVGMPINRWRTNNLRNSKTRRMTNLQLPLTLVAAIIMVFVFGGLLIFMTFGDTSTSQNNGDGTSIAGLSSVDNVTATFTPQSVDDMGILEVTHTFTPLPIVTALPEQSAATGLGGSVDQTQSMMSPDSTDTLEMMSQQAITTTLIEGCQVINNSDQNVAIYDRPSIQDNVVGTMPSGSQLSVLARSANGWFRVSDVDSSDLGWVNGRIVITQGNCGTIPLPTPTLLATNLATSCIASSLDTETQVDIREGPGQRYSVINVISEQNTADVLARSDNGWYQVRYVQMSVEWVGWVQSESVQLYLNCENLVTIRSTNFVLATPTHRVLVTPMPPRISPTITSVITLPTVVHFTPSSDSVSEGATIVLSWETQNSSAVWLEYGTSNDVVLGVYDNLSPTGTISFTLPQNYVGDLIVFNLVIDTFDEVGRNRGETLVITVE